MFDMVWGGSQQLLPLCLLFFDLIPSRNIGTYHRELFWFRSVELCKLTRGGNQAYLTTNKSRQRQSQVMNPVSCQFYCSRSLFLLFLRYSGSHSLHSRSGELAFCTNSHWNHIICVFFAFLHVIIKFRKKTECAVFNYVAHVIYTL